MCRADELLALNPPKRSLPSGVPKAAWPPVRSPPCTDAHSRTYASAMRSGKIIRTASQFLAPLLILIGCLTLSFSGYEWRGLMAWSLLGTGVVIMITVALSGRRHPRDSNAHPGESRNG